MLNKYLRNIGLKVSQIIILLRAPTCLVPALATTKHILTGSLRHAYLKVNTKFFAETKHNCLSNIIELYGET
jgi:Fe2+ transport system protein B